MRHDGFVMPKVDVGDLVMYYHRRDHVGQAGVPPLLGMVKKIDDHTIEVNYYPPGGLVGITQGVHFHSDPFLNHRDASATSCFGLFPKQVSINELVELLPNIVELVEMLPILKDVVATWKERQTPKKEKTAAA